MKYLDLIRNKDLDNLKNSVYWSSKTEQIVKDWEVVLTKNGNLLTIEDISETLNKVKSIIEKDEFEIKINDFEKSITSSIREIYENKKELNSLYMKLNKLKSISNYIKLIYKINEITESIKFSVNNLNYCYSELIHLSELHKNNKSIKNLILKLENFKKGE